MAPAARARSALASVEPLSTTITSPETPAARMPAQAERTQAPIVASSSRHGITTETPSGEEAGAGARSAVGLRALLSRAARATATTPTITRGTVFTTCSTSAAETAAAGVAP